MMLSHFRDKDFLPAIKALFKDLKVPMNYVADEPTTAKDILRDTYKDNDTFHLMHDIYFVGMVDDAAFAGNQSPAASQIKSDYDGILIFGVTLHKRLNNLLPTRTQLAEISRAFNRQFCYTPVVLVFKYKDDHTDYLAFANTERLPYKQEWREGERAGKVSLLRDIDIENPHTGHIRILKELKIERSGKNAIHSFSQLYYYWQSVFSISVLNKSFYEEIIKWFDQAIQDIRIPGEQPKSEKHKDFTVRLIARLIFIWFLKELKVVKESLLLPKFYNGNQNDLIIPQTNGSAYYKFILQNLFFNALNAEKEGRESGLFDVFSSAFPKAEEIKKEIFYSPYLNGGLFDQHPNDWCDKVNNAFEVPDHLFLDEQTGLNSILASYKFTIAENTPLEEEIAVDPEMLGRIFENLLAEQSDDTKEAARKNTGAFYTPRPVVSHMCRNTLLKHLDLEIKPENGKQIIHKILDTTVLDPACGSGAFPMGMLEEMMNVLETVDPDGNLWIAEMLKSHDEDFKNHIADFIADNQVRYVKKLGLLRNCLFGIDLLEYAVEITKLRCWLSLIVEQKVDFNKPNYNLKPLPNLEFKFYKKNTLFRYYKEQNLNELIDSVDDEHLLDELIDLENEYFIAKSGNHGSKEEIKQKIIALLEKVVDSKIDKTQKEFNTAQNTVNYFVSSGASTRDINQAKKKASKLAQELTDLADFKYTIKDYFIERVVYPGIFSRKQDKPGFDIVIGNPPYVNTKLINSMGLTKKLETEYGYCDDLYNHFTIRGLELLKTGGLLSYITSDTFLTLQTKKNMRREFLGIPKVTENGEGLFAEEKKELPESHLTDIINTPKAFAALVNTAIFTVQKTQLNKNSVVTYVDIRQPTAESFQISEEEWRHLKTSKNNLASWERVLDQTFTALEHDSPDWVESHSCDGNQVYKDNNSNLLKYKLPFEPYRQAINYAIFSPTPYNCQILEKIIKPARPVFDKWWKKIETSRLIESNRSAIQQYISSLTYDDWTIMGLITDGGVGLQTGDNGRFVGYRSSIRYANRCKQTRIDKLNDAIIEHPEITSKWNQLADVTNKVDLEERLNNLTEPEVWKVFDEIKAEYGLRVFGKGFMYRIIPPELEFDPNQISETQKTNGINSDVCWVPYDKGEKEGNRWYSETPYLIDWSKEAVAILSTDSKARWQGYNFFFRNGFCWNDVLDPSNNYIKARLKAKTVNDVKSMALYDESGVGDKYIVGNINSFLFNKMLREFFNGTVAIQMNDIRKIPIKIPSNTEAENLKQKVDECIAVQQQYFNNEIEKTEAREKLKPLENEIDEMVNQFYGITEDVNIEEVGEDNDEVLVESEIENRSD